MAPNPIYEMPEHFARRNGLQFNDYMLLCRALTHSSFLNEHPDAIEDNERLEFLGDAVLDFMIGAWLYNKFPEMKEGQLSKYRSALVQTTTLADFARQVDLGQALRLGRGEYLASGKSKTALLCDAFEALVGALYLDQGLDAVKAFVMPFMEGAIDDIIIHHKDDDAKSRLQEILQAKNMPVPHYEVVRELGPDHSKIYEMEVCIGDNVLGVGQGSSKQNAAKQAAQNALENLGYGVYGQEPEK